LRLFPGNLLTAEDLEAEVDGMAVCFVIINDHLI